MEKKESPKGERAVKPVISLPSEKWVLKIGFLKVHQKGKCPACGAEISGKSKFCPECGEKLK